MRHLRLHLLCAKSKISLLSWQCFKSIFLQLNFLHKSSTNQKEREVILCTFDVIASFQKYPFQLFEKLLTYLCVQLDDVSNLRKTDLGLLSLITTEQSLEYLCLSIISLEFLSKLLEHVATDLMSDSKSRYKTHGAKHLHWLFYKFTSFISSHSSLIVAVPFCVQIL